MHLHRDSAAGVRFLGAVREGRGVKPSARAAGVGKETGYRWLREAFGALREQGLSVLEAQALLGYFSALVLGWDERRTAGLGEESRCRRNPTVTAKRRLWWTGGAARTSGSACRLIVDVSPWPEPDLSLRSRAAGSAHVWSPWSGGSPPSFIRSDRVPAPLGQLGGRRVIEDGAPHPRSKTGV